MVPSEANISLYLIDDEKKMKTGYRSGRLSLMRTAPLLSWLGDAQVSANFPCQEVIDFPVSWHCGSLVIRGVHVNAVFPPVAQQTTTVRLNMTDQIY